MWRDRIIEAKKEKGISTKSMAEYAGMTEKTVSAFLHGKTQPYVGTVITLGEAVGLTPTEIFMETGLVVGSQDLASAQAEVERLTNEIESVKAERDLLIAENKALSSNVSALTAENNILQVRIEMKDEIIATHVMYQTKGR